MRPLVGLCVALMCKCLPTLLALVGFLPCMGPFVDCKGRYDQQMPSHTARTRIYKVSPWYASFYVRISCSFAQISSDTRRIGRGSPLYAYSCVRLRFVSFQIPPHTARIYKVWYVSSRAESSGSYLRIHAHTGRIGSVSRLFAPLHSLCMGNSGCIRGAGRGFAVGCFLCCNLNW